MDKVYQQIQDAIQKYSKIAIAVGKNPTLDEMGAALSLYLSLQVMGKNPAIASPTEPLVAISSLVGIDKVKKEFGGDSGDLTVSFPYKEGEIEKISYTLENGALNIIVKAGELGLTFNERDIQYIRSGGAPELLFVIGTSRLSDLGTLFDAEKLKDTMVINIDNKADNQGFGDIVMVTPQMSSVSEMVADLLSILKMPLDLDMSQNLFSGILYATNNFQNLGTSATALSTAGILMKNGAVRMEQKRETQTIEDMLPRQQIPQPQDDMNFDEDFPQSASLNGQMPPMPMPTMQPRAPRMPQQNVASRFPNAAQQPRRQNLSQPFPPRQQQNQQSNQQQTTPPTDWLTPKIYKGSTTV